LCITITGTNNWCASCFDALRSETILKPKQK
jgi:hypothetical protein